MKTISIIIPCCNEAGTIDRLCTFLQKQKQADKRLIEVIVVDAESNDGTQKIALAHKFQLIKSAKKSRAIQMNLGASHANGDILHFIHADVLPPETFLDDVIDAVSDGVDFGCFSYQFDHPSRLLQFNASFTSKDSSFIGGGDQTLFIKREVFDALGGFNNDHVIMEDYELYWKAKKQYKHRIITNDALVSARKYSKNSYLRVQFANLVAFNGYKLGVSQKRLRNWYRTLLN